MKRLNKMIFILMPCFSLIFVIGTSQGGVVPLTWSGTVTADAQARDVHNIDTETYSAHAEAHWMPPEPPELGVDASAGVSISDGDTASIYAHLDFGVGMTAGGMASFSIAGTFAIGSSPEFPVGTPLDLTLSGGIWGCGMPFFLDNRLCRNGNCIWSRGGGGGSFTDSCQVFAGETLNLDSWGSAASMVVNQYIGLEVTPEPATLLLFGLGGLMLRRKRRTRA